MKILPIIVAFIVTDLAQADGCPAGGTEVTPPSVVQKVEPEYTAEARVKRVEGVIKLYVEITKEGSAVNIEVLRTLDPGLDAKAVQAVRQWRFRPAKKDGQPVRMTAIIDVDFRLPRYPLLKSLSPLPAVDLVNDDVWRMLIP
jgi:TonB family protein